MIIGISGSFASGQDTLAHYLRDKYGFVWYSTSDMVRKFSMDRHGSIERPMLFETAAHLRKTRGGGVLVELGYEEYKLLDDQPGLIISGIRSMGEMNAVLKLKGKMIYTDAELELRYERMVMRQRDEEAKISREEFDKREQAEWHTGNESSDFNKRDIRKYCEKHDMIVFNQADLASFFHDAEQKLGL